MSAVLKRPSRHPERPHLSSSQYDRHLVHDTPLGRVGMLICWDLAFPEAFRELISQGAKIIIIPTFCESLSSFAPTSWPILIASVRHSLTRLHKGLWPTARRTAWVLTRVPRNCSCRQW